MKILINACRYLVGILFIFSGLIKANDPLGLSYKMQEFFEVWQIHGLDQFTLTLSVTMILFEILAGVALILGWQMRIFSWLLLLLMIFFTFLTGYAYLSGKVRECGCFGNCIPLTAGQSFAKDLVLLALIIFLFIRHRDIRPVAVKAVNLGILFFTVVFAFSLQWYALVHLPPVDCLPYHKNANISAQMKVPPGAVPDSMAISFVYDHKGKTVEFTADQFPADFDDSYKFVKRYDKLIRKGNAEPAIKDFVLTSASGTDTTQAILQQRGYSLFLFARDVPETNPDWNPEFAAIVTLAKMKNLTIYFITANVDQANAFLQADNITDHIVVLSCDVTAIKTAARANPVLYLIKQGTVAEKWSYADFDRAMLEISGLPVQVQGLAMNTTP